MGLDNFDFDNTAFNGGAWYLNENVELGYLSACASDSIPLDTEIDIEDETEGDNNI